MLAAAVTLIPGSTAMFTDGVYTWVGPVECVTADLLPKPGGPVIDQGAWIAGFHCPAAGPDPSGCREWAGQAPDLGACEYVSGPNTANAPNAPTSVKLR